MNRALNLLIPLEVPNNRSNDLQVMARFEQGKPAATQAQRKAVSTSDRTRRTAAIVRCETRKFLYITQLTI